MLETLGVHSNASSSDSLTDGHAWLSMHFTNGRGTTVGLWTPTLFQPQRFVKDSTGVFLDQSFDVNFGLEEKLRYRARASRYYGLDAAQARRAVHILGHYHSWRISHTCASWAREVVRELLGEDLDAGELAGATDTPRRLAAAIIELERREPTSLALPKRIRGNAIANASTAGVHR